MTPMPASSMTLKLWATASKRSCFLRSWIPFWSAFPHRIRGVVVLAEGERIGGKIVGIASPIGESGAGHARGFTVEALRTIRLAIKLEHDDLSARPA